MKKLSIIVSLLLAGLIGANSALCQQTAAAKLTGVGVSPQTAAVLEEIFGKTISPVGDLTILADADTQRAHIIGASSDTALSYAFGDAGATATQKFTLQATTLPGDDDAEIIIAPSSSATASDGGTIKIRGNELATTGGSVEISGGTASSGSVHLVTNNASSRINFTNSSGSTTWYISDAGEVISNSSTGGNVNLSKSGTSIALQEATPSTACMGVSTPNGNTAVTVTTSCAVSGSRVFFSRAGAITNMGTVTTTTAPNGTSFAFASTGASDTTASSVVWMIVKEAA